jgi:hypothetical protein
MRAVEVIGFSLGVIAIVVALLLFLMGGPAYRRKNGKGKPEDGQQET